MGFLLHVDQNLPSCIRRRYGTPVPLHAAALCPLPVVIVMGSRPSQIVAGAHRGGEGRLWDLEILKVDGGAVVKDLTAAALLQLAVKHQGAVKVKLYMACSYVEVLQQTQV